MPGTLRWSAAIFVVAAFLAVVTMLTRDSSPKQAPVNLPLRPTESPQEIATADARFAEFIDSLDDSLEGELLVPGTEPGEGPALTLILPQAQVEKSGKATEEKVGWPVLTHPDNVNGFLITDRGRIIVRQSVLVDGVSVTLSQSGGLFVRSLVADDEYATNAAVGRYDVTFYRSTDNSVEATFETGPRSEDGIPVVATVEGPDVDSVVRFIRELRFAD